MNSIILLSQVYKEGLASGVFSKDDVISWVDKVIEIQDNPPYEFIEISLMSKTRINDIEGKLGEFYKELDISYVTKVVLSIIYYNLSNGRITIEKAIRLVAKLLLNTGECFEREYQSLYYCDDAYDLAMQGVHHSLKDVIKVFKSGIEKYSDYINDFRIAYKEVMGFEWEKN
ncbi:MAG: protein kinase [Bacillota bacterium]|nr:protein kinase [Bacillota bacterium]